MPWLVARQRSTLIIWPVFPSYSHPTISSSQLPTSYFLRNYQQLTSSWTTNISLSPWLPRTHFLLDFELPTSFETTNISHPEGIQKVILPPWAPNVLLIISSLTSNISFPLGLLNLSFEGNLKVSLPSGLQTRKNSLKTQNISLLSVF